METLESQIAEWRGFVARAPAVDGRDVEELEGHLREQIADLGAAGLAEDEAFLIAVKRIGGVDALSSEYAREHSGRLWKQLMLSEAPTNEASRRWPEVLAFAVAAGTAIQIARLVASFPTEEPTWFLRNMSVFVVPLLAVYFGRRRRIPIRQSLVAASVLATVVVLANLYPYRDGSSTEALVAGHLPLVMWFAVGIAYMGGAVLSRERRMDFVRFTGEWSVYYVLIALGGGVLMALTVLILEPTGERNAERVIEWVLPSGAAGAVIVAAWLVEWKQRIVENMAPVLTTLFTPLFAVMLACAAIVYAVTGFDGPFDRELVGVFDALMVVVLGLVLYGMSARDPSAPPGWMDRIQLVAVVSALILDFMVLGSMIARIGELGFTPNRSVAVGLNLVLLANLAGTAWLGSRFLLGRTTYHRLERWQTGYFPVFAAWVAAVVVVLPPLFAFA